jgi:hypothetical protein
VAENPKQLVVGSDRPAVFDEQPELFAVRNADTGTTNAVAVVQDTADERFLVYKDGPPGSPAAAARLPVYSVGVDGPLAVATGRVLVRLDPGAKAAEHADAFRAAGFEIDRLLSYAPHCAWLRPRDGDAGEALRSLDALAHVPGVVHVEPQMLLERAEK